MPDKSSLLQRVEKLQSKIDTEEMWVQNVFIIMKFFGISYIDVMNMPVPAFNECVKFVSDNLKENKQPMGKHLNIKGLG